jgi:hypothetical protein
VFLTPTLTPSGREIIYRGLREMDEGALGTERFCLKRLSAEGLWKICEERL